MAFDNKPTIATPKTIGIRTYVFKYGLVGWGFGSGLAYLAMEWARHPSEILKTLAWAAWFFPLLGLVAGFLMWLLGRVFGNPKSL